MNHSQILDELESLRKDCEHNFNQGVLYLIREQIDKEYGFRRLRVRDYIRSLGLSEYEDDIIQGMNKTCRRV